MDILNNRMTMLSGYLGGCLPISLTLCRQSRTLRAFSELKNGSKMAFKEVTETRKTMVKVLEHKALIEAKTNVFFVSQL